MTQKSNKTITVHIDRKRWQGIENEAGLLSAVFGFPITPERVAQATVDRALQARERRFAVK